MEKKDISSKITIKSPLQKTLITSVSIIVTATVLGLAVYFYNQYRTAQKLLKNPTLAAAEEVKTIVSAVGKLIELPKNEQPTLATVFDKSKLKNQPFFQKAENGDKVLIYTNEKKAILYRPSINKIIEVSFLSFISPNNQSASPSNTPTPTQTRLAKVAIYNGTKTVGLSSMIEKKITEKFPNVQVVLKTDAKGDYEKNLIIDLTGNNKDLSRQLINLLGGEIGSIPQNEVKPDANILIILGK